MSQSQEVCAVGALFFLFRLVQFDSMQKNLFFLSNWLPGSNSFRAKVFLRAAHRNLEQCRNICNT